MMTPSPSPDELIIQQRGRRKIPVTFSPDIDAIKQVSINLLYFNTLIFQLKNVHVITFLNLVNCICINVLDDLKFLFYFTHPISFFLNISLLLR